MLTESEIAEVATLYPASAFATPHHRTAEIFGDVIFVCPSEQLSQTLSGTETYRYRFNWTSTQSGVPLVVHSKDIAYVFNDVATVPKTDNDQLVLKHFQHYWTSFALSGSPNGLAGNSKQDVATEITWPLFTNDTKQQLVIQPALAIETSGTQRAGHAERCAFWFDVEKRIANDVAFA